ncbi:ATP-binding protein [Thalassospiraceae bacterium LMO-JJ14]|nr:ATP-binding protein [Thalassospiraceae bacterium LMO-JJ14]
MSEQNPTLHMVCGKIASGKSTLASSLAKAPRTVLISEDLWLSNLYADELRNIADYVRCSAHLRAAIGPHIVELLQNGTSVVLDFPANTRQIRAWMHSLIKEAGAAHALHLLDLPDAVCKERLRERNAAGTHEFTVSDEQFDQITRHFERPVPDEGFKIVIY